MDNYIIKIIIINHLIQQGCITLIKSDSKDFYIYI